MPEEKNSLGLVQMVCRERSKPAKKKPTLDRHRRRRGTHGMGSMQQKAGQPWHPGIRRKNTNRLEDEKYHELKDTQGEEVRNARKVKSAHPTGQGENGETEKKHRRNEE